MCFYARRSVGYKTLCVRRDATTGTATNAVCLLARERTERTKGNERESCGFEKSCRYFSRLFVNVPFLLGNDSIEDSRPRKRNIKERQREPFERQE